MKLIHFSREPLNTVHSVPQELRGDRLNSIGDKPHGLWISDEAAELSWLKWCLGEQWRIDGLKFSHEIHLKSDANILKLNSHKDINDFTKEFGKKRYSALKNVINWKTVCQKFQGIIITPYIWESRLDINSFWYYTWDCASGVIWDADAVKTLGKPTETGLC